MQLGLCMVDPRLAALSDMAAARPPGVSDARVPCPLCGGLIHPVAGRCKHCKQDLAALRSARPQASAPLPALDGKSAPIEVPVVPTAPAPHSEPILPPRPTGRSVTAQASPRPAWRSWPVLVIVVASLAIVSAVAIMMWPHSSEASKKHVLQPPPAPERMDTDPLPPPQPSAPDTDPWGPPAAPRHGAIDPPRVPQQAAPNDPDLIDPFSNLHGAAPGPTSPNAVRLFSAISKHLCDKLPQCTGNPTIANALCSAYGQGQIAVPTCAAAQRCMHDIDSLSCEDATDAATSYDVMQKLQDCMEAINC